MLWLRRHADGRGASSKAQTAIVSCGVEHAAGAHLHRSVSSKCSRSPSALFRPPQGFLQTSTSDCRFCDSVYRFCATPFRGCRRYLTRLLYFSSSYLLHRQEDGEEEEGEKGHEGRRDLRMRVAREEAEERMEEDGRTNNLPHDFNRPQPMDQGRPNNRPHKDDIPEEITPRPHKVRGTLQKLTYSGGLPLNRARHGHRTIDRQDPIKPPYHLSIRLSHEFFTGVV